MQDFKVGEYEDANKKKSGVISTLLTAILILLLFLPLFSHMDPPPGQEGILVNLGEIDVGQGEENAPPPKPQPEEREPETAPEEVKEDTKPEPTPKKPEVKKPKVKTPKPVVKETVVTEDPDAIRIKKEKEKKEREEEKKKREEEAAEEAREAAEEEAREAKIAEERRKKAEAAEKKRKAAEAARRKAEAKAKADALDGLFGDGGGQGNTGTSGNQGDPNGDPDSKILEGKSTGAGKVGGGLGRRGIVSAPKIVDNSQDTGVVVVDVCVDRNGRVTKAEIRQTKTTTTSSRLKQLAVSNTKKYRFKKDSSASETQCGTITYDFRLK